MPDGRKVDKRIVKKLKPHQVGGIKFMWDSVFESQEKVEKGESTSSRTGRLALCDQADRNVYPILHRVYKRKISAPPAPPANEGGT